MFSILYWNLYIGPLLLALGIISQAIFIYNPKISFILPLFGSLCISIICYIDSDIILFIGQIIILFFEYLLRQKKG